MLAALFFLHSEMNEEMKRVLIKHRHCQFLSEVSGF